MASSKEMKMQSDKNAKKNPPPSKSGTTVTKIRWMSRDVLVAARVEAAKAEMGLSDWVLCAVIERLGSAQS